MSISCSLPPEPAPAAAVAAHAATMRPIRRALQQPMERDRKSDGPPGTARHIYCCFIMLLLLLRALFWLHFCAIFPTFWTPFSPAPPLMSAPVSLPLSLFSQSAPSFNGRSSLTSLLPNPPILTVSTTLSFFLAKMVVKKTE